MSDQPIPQQEVDPVRGLVEALRHEIRNCPMCRGDGVTTETAAHVFGTIPADEKVECPRCKNARQASAAYRAWEEGGGSDSAGRSGRPQEAPSPTGLLSPTNQDTFRMLQRFSEALADKLARAELKYGYTNGWLTEDWEDECRRQLREHMEKGDPLDVAAYAAFCWARGWSTAIPSPGAALEAAGVDRADTLSDPIPSPPASAPPEGWREAAARAMHEVLGSGDPDALMRHPAANSWDAPTEPRWTQWLEAVDAVASAAPPPPAGVDRPETEGEATLPHDVFIGSAKFSAGVRLSTFIEAAQRWYDKAAAPQPEGPPAMGVEGAALEQPDFDYFECRECGFDSVQRSDFNGSEYCPLCEGDSGHSVRMTRRTCRATDKPEGHDARAILALSPQPVPARGEEGVG